ncbi:phage baseplate assembly protein V [Paenibacillus sp. USDA918EY]|uniref:phage baseplate assembly protein V n=1 Tax=Paenibacillus sp. USDA918EY TaxID=2689575 RepID=UPI00135781E6|nr:phage baseplate assembly protein V [Paenibacillus sp. USDA918EY]
MAANLLAELVKIGECSTVDFETGTITATFPDRQDKVSRDIPVLFAGGFGTGNGMPKEGDTVLCLMLGNGKSNGVCLGVIPDAVPGTADQQGVYFEDGSYVYYDRSQKKLMVKAASGVQIDGDLTVTGRVTAANII